MVDIVEVLDAHAHVVFQILRFFATQRALLEVERVGSRTVDAHHRHDTCIQQQLGEFQATIVQELDPFHTQPLQFRNPAAAQLTGANKAGVAAAPVHANAVVLRGTGIVLQAHGGTSLRTLGCAGGVAASP